jgi:hypothetical protein
VPLSESMKFRTWGRVKTGIATVGLKSGESIAAHPDLAVRANKEDTTWRQPGFLFSYPP